ncbi:MAG: hypothetical protein JSS86_11170 [Cyanobacteria bacterium SZAS LIN-2]|nr:hypothetical protein [Cyanobacteria bacterium SZAS LIN-2]
MTAGGPSALSAPAAPAVNTKKLSGYEVEELTSLNGKYKVLAVEDAVRVEHYNNGYVVVSRAPKWDVFLYRPDSREYAQVAYKDWLKANLVLLTTMWTMELKKPTAQKRFLQSGRPVVLYSFPNTDVVSGFYRTTAKGEFDDMINNRGEVLCLDFPKDVHAGGISGRVMALPELQGVALQATRTSQKVKSWSLKNGSIKHRDDISPAQFDLPAGYKKVPFGRTLFSSSSEKDAVNDLMGGPGDKP